VVTVNNIDNINDYLFIAFDKDHYLLVLANKDRIQFIQVPEKHFKEGTTCIDASTL
jgi:hypothetical protein